MYSLMYFAAAALLVAELPATANTSLPLRAHTLIFSSRPSDKTPSSLKAHKRTDASDPERNVSLKLD